MISVPGRTVEVCHNTWLSLLSKEESEVVEIRAPWIWVYAHASEVLVLRDFKLRRPIYLQRLPVEVENRLIVSIPELNGS